MINQLKGIDSKESMPFFFIGLIKITGIDEYQMI